MGSLAGKNSRKRNTESEQTIEVLYQKMGDRWFAFSLVDDEVLFGSISQSEIEMSLKPQSSPDKDGSNYS